MLRYYQVKTKKHTMNFSNKSRTKQRQNDEIQNKCDRFGAEAAVYSNVKQRVQMKAGPLLMHNLINS